MQTQACGAHIDIMQTLSLESNMCTKKLIGRCDTSVLGMCGYVHVLFIRVHRTASTQRHKQINQSMTQRKTVSSIYASSLYNTQDMLDVSQSKSTVDTSQSDPTSTVLSDWETSNIQSWVLYNEAAPFDGAASKTKVFKASAACNQQSMMAWHKLHKHTQAPSAERGYACHKGL